MIEISLVTTRDDPDGQPWPPADDRALWVIVRRTDGCTLWRAIQISVAGDRDHPEKTGSHLSLIGCADTLLEQLNARRTDPSDGKEFGHHPGCGRPLRRT